MSDPDNGNREMLELGKTLIASARNGDTERVVELMKYGAPFATDWWGMTSLHHAALKGHLTTCEILVRAGILKDARSKVEKTPLHLACQEGHSEVALFLLGNGADVNAVDLILMTPLHWAVEMNHVGTVDVLLQNGADPHMTNKFDKTSFDIASEHGNDSILSLLENGPKEGLLTVTMNDQLRFKDVVKKRTIRVLKRPQTPVVFPTIIKRMKPSPVKVEPIRIEAPSRTPEMEEEQVRLFLEQQGIEMLEGEDVNLVASAMDSGQTVILTEAGRQALSLTETPGQLPFPSSEDDDEEEEDDDAIAVKYLQAQREAEKFRVLYDKKRREVLQYKNKLKTITQKTSHDRFISSSSDDDLGDTLF